jgi:peptide deformylase
MSNPVLLDILQYPDPRLHIVAKPVIQFDEALYTLVRNMSHTMYQAPGVGLAATQVNVHQRVICVDCSENSNQLIVFINPVIISVSSDLQAWEGCLSVPDVYEDVKRPKFVRVKAQDIQGNFFELEADELLSVCIQHEIDHLNGKVFVQHLSQLKQGRIKNKFLKLAKSSKNTDKNIDKNTNKNTDDINVMDSK